MRGGSIQFIVSIVLFLLVVDAYAFRGIRILTQELPYLWRFLVHGLYWMVPLLILTLMVWISLNFSRAFASGQFRVWSFMVGIFILFYVPKLVFIVFQMGNDLVRLAGYLISRGQPNHESLAATAQTMTRAEFLTKIGILVAAIPFVSVLHGITRGRFNYKVKNVVLSFTNLPPAFDGFRIIQLSDWHIGSFLGQEKQVERAVKLINAQNADLLLFTGDMVNNTALELEPFVNLLKQLKAPYGKFSILGNHDYGDYVPWKSLEEKQANLEKLCRLEQESGFTVLRNQNVLLERDQQTIALAGVENWGLPPFPQYGRLADALRGVEQVPFKILLSHDPSHWDAEIRPASNVDLTLSGHTHGMQFGINIPGLRWSPVKWKYPRWNGLYVEGLHHLYVNVGIGYLAFPGRVGFHPEITVFELCCS